MRRKVGWITLGAVLLATALFVIYSAVPELRFHYEIEAGNRIVAVIEHYHDMTGSFPPRQDHSLLRKLVLDAVNDRNWFYELFYPDYQLFGDEFQLAYVLGFDGPYLTYSSKTGVWKMLP